MKSMKRFLCVLGLGLGAFSLCAAPPTKSWVLFWSPPTNGMPVLLTSYIPLTNQAYKVYGTATLNTSLTNWPLLALITSWSIRTNSQNQIEYFQTVGVPTSDDWFFAMTATNFQGESPFTQVVHSGPVYQQPQTLGLSVGP